MAFQDVFLAPATAVGVALIAGTIGYVGLVSTKESKVSEFRQKWINDLREEVAVYISAVDTLMEHIAKDNRGKMFGREILMLSKLDHSESYTDMLKARVSIILRINENEERNEDKEANTEFLRLIDSVADNFESANFIKTRLAMKLLIPASKRILKHEWNRARDGEKGFGRAKLAAQIMIGAAAIFALATIGASVYLAFTGAPDSNLNKPQASASASQQGAAIKLPPPH